MKPWDKIFRVLILIIGFGVIGFDALLYNFCEQQKGAMMAMSDQQKAVAEDSNNKFKYQQEQIAQLSKDLQDVKDQIKTQQDGLSEQKDALSQQKEAFIQEVEKRQQLENENKNVQKSLMDIKAEADAIKDDMNGWQKDYVNVLAGLDKKVDLESFEIKSVEDNLTAMNIPELKQSIQSLNAQIDLLNHPPVSTTPPPTAPAAVPADSDTKVYQSY